MHPFDVAGLSRRLGTLAAIVFVAAWLVDADWTGQVVLQLVDQYAARVYERLVDALAPMLAQGAGAAQ